MSADTSSGLFRLRDWGHAAPRPSRARPSVRQEEDQRRPCARNGELRSFGPASEESPAGFRHSELTYRVAPAIQNDEELALSLGQMLAELLHGDAPEARRHHALLDPAI